MSFTQLKLDGKLRLICPTASITSGIIKNNIYIDDHLPVILEEYEKMSHKELEQSCEKMKKETLKEKKCSYHC